MKTAPIRLPLSLLLLGAASLLTSPPCARAENVYTFHKEDHGGLSVRVNNQPFATYVVHEANKPFLWPVYGPTGKPMTRAYPMQEVDSESKAQRDHPHHRAICFGHESAGNADWRFPEKAGDPPPQGGGDTWHEKATFEEFLKDPKRAETGARRLQTLGSIRHREYTVMRTDASGAVFGTVCEHLDASGRQFLTEERRFTFRADDAVRSIDIDQDFVATEGPVRFEDRKDSGLSIRVPASMAVDSKLGGKIINSDGQVNADAWGKPAPWCSYHGPVEGEELGISFLNHPSSHRFPTRWHVRTYGLFTANPFCGKQFNKELPDATTTLAPGERLKLRHRLIFHRGDAQTARIAERYSQYAQEPK
jgi:hypothetical protein